MATEVNPAKSFPVATFARQYGIACQVDVQASQIIVHSFRSKKHATAEIMITGGNVENVGMNGSIFIAKYFENKDIDSLNHELTISSYALKAGIPVPRILHVLENFLVMEKVDGRTLMDLINAEEIPLEYKEEIMEGLGCWLYKFHTAFAIHPEARRRGDANLRNFIASGSLTVLGLDFEEASLEDPACDLYEVIDSILQSDPGIKTEGNPNIDWKYMICERLLRGYAAPSRKKPIEIIKDPRAFIDAQLVTIKALAIIRGTSERVLSRLPEIKWNLERVMERLDSSII